MRTLDAQRLAAGGRGGRAPDGGDRTRGRGTQGRGKSRKREGSARHGGSERAESKGVDRREDPDRRSESNHDDGRGAAGSGTRVDDGVLAHTD